MSQRIQVSGQRQDVKISYEFDRVIQDVLDKDRTLKFRISYEFDRVIQDVLDKDRTLIS